MTTQSQTAGAIVSDRLYTYEEVAELLAITKFHVRNLVRDGLIGYTKVSREGRRRRISGQHILDYQSRNSVDPVEV